jgi:ABC-2 type transport system permease protein
MYRHTSHLGNWTKDQWFFFLSCILVIDQWHMTFVSQNFWMLPQFIKNGQFDFILLRPVSSLFISFFRHIRVASFLNIFLTIPAVLYFGSKVGLQWPQFLLLIFPLFLGFLLLIQIEQILMCWIFWLIEGWGLNFLRMELQRLTRWPESIFPKWPRKIFTFVVPILLVSNAPVGLFLGSENGIILFLGLMLANGCAFFVLKKLWKFSLYRYESASS